MKLIARKAAESVGVVHTDKKNQLNKQQQSLKQNCGLCFCLPRKSRKDWPRTQQTVEWKPRIPLGVKLALSRSATVTVKIHLGFTLKNTAKKGSYEPKAPNNREYIILNMKTGVLAAIFMCSLQQLCKLKVKNPH